MVGGRPSSAVTSTRPSIYTYLPHNINIYMRFVSICQLSSLTHSLRTLPCRNHIQKILFSGIHLVSDARIINKRDQYTVFFSRTCRVILKHIKTEYKYTNQHKKGLEFMGDLCIELLLHLYDFARLSPHPHHCHPT